MAENKEYEMALKQAMRLLSGKDYSKKALIQKLTDKKFSPETCESIMERLTEYGYIDDARYAKKLARNYIEVKKYGKKRAKMMMIEKGLSSALADKALSKYSDEEIIDEIIAIIEKKYYDSFFESGLEGHKERQKAMAALARRGYGYEQIKKAVAEVINGAEYDD